MNPWFMSTVKLTREGRRESWVKVLTSRAFDGGILSTLFPDISVTASRVKDKKVLFLILSKPSMPLMALPSAKDSCTIKTAESAVMGQLSVSE